MHHSVHCIVNANRLQTVSLKTIFFMLLAALSFRIFGDCNNYFTIYLLVENYLKTIFILITIIKGN